MPVIRSVQTAVPPHAVSQETVKTLARAHFGPALPHTDRYLSVFANAQIDTRYFAAPPEWFTTPRSFQECNNLFVNVAIELGERAGRAALTAAGLGARNIDHLIWVSTTGMAAPSPDAMLIGRMGMDIHTRRTPIWGLGCAGGVAGLARAAEYVRAYPEQRALLLSVELCSVTFQWGDTSAKNLVAASLFADGAAAVLVEGDAVAADAPGGLQILGTQSTVWPETLDVMGWEIVNSGMQVVFGTRIPTMVRELMAENVRELLTAHGLTLADIKHWVLHPGGAKVIQAYAAALELEPQQLARTRTILRDYGNMSSATVFFVLEQFMAQQAFAPGEYGVLAVLGPGFSCELALVRQA